MAQFKPKKLNIESIHGGQKYAESRTPFLPSDVNEIIETLYGTSEGLKLSSRKASLLLPDDKIIEIDLYENNIIFPNDTIIVLNGKRIQLPKTTVKIIKYDMYFIVRFNTDTKDIETALTVDDADEYKNYYLFSVCLNPNDGKRLTDLDVAYSLDGNSFKISNLTVRSSYNGVDASTTALMTESAVADALKKAVIENQTDGLAYELSKDGTHYICKGIGKATDTDIIIASKVNGIPVTKIYDNAFESSSIASVIIPDSVKYINYSAFYDCSSLTSVTLGNSVEAIVENAFYNCENLTSINLPDSLIEIGGDAFYNCNNLKNIWIPKSVENIGWAAFSGSYNIYCEAESQPKDWDFNWLIGTNKVFWNVKSKNGILIFQETGESEDAVMSQKAATKHFVAINEDGSTSVGAPKSGESAINAYALKRHLTRHSNLYPSKEEEGVIVVNKLKFIMPANDSYFALVGDHSAETGGANPKVSFDTNYAVHIPSVVPSAQYFPADSPYYVPVDLPVNSIRQNAFAQNRTVKSVVIQEGVSRIEANAFNGCKQLTSIVLADTIKMIDNNAFNNVGTEASGAKILVKLPRALEWICQQAFNNVNVCGSITFPNRCLYIGGTPDNLTGGDRGRVFTSQNITQILFEGMPKYIHTDAFSGCKCDIYVPWSEGEVAGAPWGTTGNVHYNSYPNAFPNGIDDRVEIVQETGESTEAVMSQKATTDALDGKLNKVTTEYYAPRAYAVNSKGEQVMYTMAWGTSVDSIALRTTGGALMVGTPFADGHATTKKYVDDAIKNVSVGSWWENGYNPSANEFLIDLYSDVFEASVKNEEYQCRFSAYGVNVNINAQMQTFAGLVQLVKDNETIGFLTATGYAQFTVGDDSLGAYMNVYFSETSASGLGATIECHASK